MLAAVLVLAVSAAPKVLVVTVTKGFHHDSIPTLAKLVTDIGATGGGFSVDTAASDEELASKMSPKGLEAYAGVVFASTTGDLPLPDRQAFVDWVAAGHCFAGVHSASDTFHGFPPFLDMLGGEFDHHGPQTTIKVVAKDKTHPAMRSVPDGLEVFDEIYQFKRFDPARVHLLIAIDKHPETGAPVEFPLAWTRTPGKGRVFYTALGHREDVLAATWYREHLQGGLQWCLGSGQ